MQLNEATPTPTPKRRSFRNHLAVRRDCKCPLFGIGLLCVATYYLLSYSPPQSASHMPLPTASTTLTPSPTPEQGKNAKLYLQNYCNGTMSSNCLEGNIEVLTSLLNLIESEGQATSDPAEAEEVSKRERSSDQRRRNQPVGSQKTELEEFRFSRGSSRLIQIPLAVVKHPKVTTPLELDFFARLSSLFTAEDPYQNIDQVVSKEETLSAWRPGGRAVSLAVRSSRPIRLKSVDIDLETPAALDLIGMSISIEQRVELVELGTFELKAGINHLNCLSSQCEPSYEAIVLKLSRTSIRKVRMFEASEE